MLALGSENVNVVPVLINLKPTLDQIKAKRKAALCKEFDKYNKKTLM